MTLILISQEMNLRKQLLITNVYTNFKLIIRIKITLKHILCDQYLSRKLYTANPK